jgi:hypothetical protein
MVLVNSDSEDDSKWILVMDTGHSMVSFPKNRGQPIEHFLRVNKPCCPCIQPFLAQHDTHWYENNDETVNEYFQDQPYPRSAIDELGFSETQGMFQHEF